MLRCIIVTMHIYCRHTKSSMLLQNSQVLGELWESIWTASRASLC